MSRTIVSHASHSPDGDAPPDGTLLARLFHRRWTVPALAELHRAGGAKFITLLNRTGANRPSLRQTLDEAIDGGWVMRNPGYGHPLRPEYILSESGRDIGPPGVRLLERLEELSLTDLALRKWSMPLLFVMRDGPRRFSELRSALPGITDRALTLALKDLIEGELVLREVGEAYPPSPVYRPHRLTRPLVRELETMTGVPAV